MFFDSGAQGFAKKSMGYFSTVVPKGLLRSQWGVFRKKIVGLTVVPKGLLRSQWGVFRKKIVGLTVVPKGLLRSQWGVFRQWCPRVC